MCVRTLLKPFAVPRDKFIPGLRKHHNVQEGSNACEVLGHPADARLLIVNADDFGLCHGENVGTVRAITHGIASSCSLMFPAPWSLHAIHQLEAHHFPFAVHLTLVSEYNHYRWGPVAPRDKVPSLLDDSGYLPLDICFREHVPQADLGEIETEFRAQIDAVLAHGLQPTHLDSHYNAHELTEEIFDLTVNLALEYGMALRVSDSSAIKKLQQQGLPTNDHPVLDSGGISPAEKLKVLTEQLRNLPAGLSEWAIHPGVPSDELRAVMADPNDPINTGTPAGRATDLDFLISQEAADIITEEGIEILSYAPLQALWRSRN